MITRLSSVFCVATLVGAPLAGSPLPQHKHGAHKAGAPQELVITIDGRATPELVDDELALMHLLASLAPHPAEPPERVERRSYLSRSIGFGAADRVAWNAAASAIGPALSQLDDQLRRASEAGSDSGEPVTAAQMSEAKIALLRGRAKTLLTELTPQGRQSLARFLLSSVKPRIIVYGSALAK